MSRILIAEDEPRLASFLEKGLRASGFTTTVVADGPGAESLADESDFDLLILDLSLPGKDGLEVLRGTRSAGSRLPVIILTARVIPTTASRGSRAVPTTTWRSRFTSRSWSPGCASSCGAATAPQRRHSSGSAGSRSTCAPAGRASTARRSNSAPASSSSCGPSSSTPTRSSREQLLARVWGYDYDPGSNVVDVYVGYLRKKLGGQRFETVRGVGYRFRA